jgi:primase-polymerase (primpol)-like protein
MNTTIEMIPQELKDSPRWVCWKQVGDKKLPINARTGQAAKSNDPSTWSTFDDVVAAATADDSLAGLGFMLGEGFAGVDLDGCIDSTGQIQPWAQDLIAELQTYTEVSPSGTGVKLFLRGDVERGRKLQPDVTACSDKTPGIEVYGGGRYFTVTGDVLPTAKGFGIESRQGELDELVCRFWPPGKPTARRCNGVAFHGGQPVDVTERARRYLTKIPPAISGQRGHDATFHAACALVSNLI